MAELRSKTDYREMPWRNGGGTTCELYRLPHPQRPDDFALRLSIAGVAQGGPFSAFPGIDRTLMLLDGEGMALRFDGAADEMMLDRPLQPIAFAGETPVDCRLLGGGLRDFNAMVARDWGALTLRILRPAAGEVLALGGDTATLAYLHEGRLHGDGGTVAAGMLLALAAGERGRWLAAEAGVLIEVALRPHPAPAL
ncbi:HutD/Ves family protein [Chitinimonas koreensis]|uniref:HutD/Ves family protein n=1 Tax=Chitinimonas koreensis TaxID=356302 RepID=UPI0004132921|nr:HutD family protein [Chitinimonas koreensis]QNM96540.1 HutD family protein [Chitinimonas koreensis]